MAYVIGVDVGGTFTDAVLDDSAGTVLAAKAPSTPPDYSLGVIDVLEALAEQLGCPVEEMLADTHHIAHGTTSSLNALVMGNVPPSRLPHHKGAPRLDLHHERGGPVSGKLTGAAAKCHGAEKISRSHPEEARPGGDRTTRP